MDGENSPRNMKTHRVQTPNPVSLVCGMAWRGMAWHGVEWYDMY